MLGALIAFIYSEVDNVSTLQPVFNIVLIKCTENIWIALAATKSIWHRFAQFIHMDPMWDWGKTLESLIKFNKTVAKLYHSCFTYLFHSSLFVCWKTHYLILFPLLFSM